MSSRYLWLSSLLISGVIVASHRGLEERWFLALFIVLGLGHTLIAVAYGRVSKVLFLSQLMIVASTLGAVWLHTKALVGPAPAGVGEILAAFLHSTWSQPRGLLGMLLHGVVFFLLAALWLTLYPPLRRACLQVLPGWNQAESSPLSWDARWAGIYSAAAVALAIDYALYRPLYQVGGEPSAQAFFFAVGLFGVERSLPLFLLATILLALRQGSGRISGDRSTDP
ncbi:MAG: hypothetical protein AAGD01_16685 [Acidobacteriota bacterium]